MNKDVDLIWEAYNTVNEGFFSGIKSAYKEGQIEAAYKGTPNEFIRALEPFIDGIADEEYIKMLKRAIEVGNPEGSGAMKILGFLTPLYNRAVEARGGIIDFIKHMKQSGNGAQ